LNGGKGKGNQPGAGPLRGAAGDRWAVGGNPRAKLGCMGAFIADPESSGLRTWSWGGGWGRARATGGRDSFARFTRFGRSRMAVWQSTQHQIFQWLM